MRRIDAVIRRYNVVQYLVGVFIDFGSHICKLGLHRVYAEASISPVIAAELVTTS